MCNCSWFNTLSRVNEMTALIALQIVSTIICLSGLKFVCFLYALGMCSILCRTDLVCRRFITSMCRVYLTKHTAWLIIFHLYAFISKLFITHVKVN